MPQNVYGSTAPLTVSQAMALAKSALESCTVTLVGEVSEVSIKQGYKAAYFTVKDTGASMPCMMWMNRYRTSGIQLRVGQLVQMTGRFTLYARKGRMNFDVFTLSAAGEGDLRKKVADLARKLEAEGLMSPQRKRALPSMPQYIGVVTSPRGAAVHDVLRTLRRRYPLATVLLAGVPVEGKIAPSALITGLQAVVEAGAQEVLLVRGGGSFEDLMPFNDEKLARAIASCPVPVITGIGHEPDTSIADMVADVRASTPTGAAESAAPDVRELQLALDASSDRMAQAVETRLLRMREDLRQRRTRPVLANPKGLFAADERLLDTALQRLHRAVPLGLQRNKASLQQAEQRLASLGKQLTKRRSEELGAKTQLLNNAASARVSSELQQWQLAASRLHDLSPLAVIERGFSLAYNAQGEIVRSINQVKPGTEMSVKVSNGTVYAKVERTAQNESQLTIGDNR